VKPVNLTVAERRKRFSAPEESDLPRIYDELRIMKRFSAFIIVFLSFALVAGAMMSGSRGEVFAQERRKTSAKHEVSTPRKVVDFTEKKKAKEQKAEPETPAAEEPAADAKADDKTAAAGDSSSAQPSEDDPYKYRNPETDEYSYGWLMLKAFLVVGLFAAGFYFFFKYLNRKGMLPNVGRNVVQTIAVSAVGQNKSIQVVEIAGRVLIVGVTDHQISLISEITAKDEIDRIRLQSSKSTPVENFTFQDFVAEHVDSLVSFIGKFRARNERKNKKHHRDAGDRYDGSDRSDDYDNERMDYMREQRERLKRLNGYDHDKER